MACAYEKIKAPEVYIAPCHYIYVTKKQGAWILEMIDNHSINRLSPFQRSRCNSTYLRRMLLCNKWKGKDWQKKMNEVVRSSTNVEPTDENPTCWKPRFCFQPVPPLGASYRLLSRFLLYQHIYAWCWSDAAVPYLLLLSTVDSTNTVQEEWVKHTCMQCVLWAPQ